jgi:sugar phosphate isomerase/epimerase
MHEASFTISAFGDEIATDLEEQLRVLNDLRIEHLELRTAWGKNVLHLDDEEVRRVREACAERGTSISSIGSPIGKSPIADPVALEIGNLSRIFEIGEALGTRRVRIFSFYPPDTSTNARYDQWVDQSIYRLAKLTDMAARQGFVLLLENEKAIVGDTIHRCHSIVSAIDSPHLRFLWDPANFVGVGESEPTERGWPLLGPYVAYVHIKDALLADRSVRAAGEGDGQIPELLDRLRNAGYRGFLSLEPHLAVAGHSSGFSGPAGMTYAASKLRSLLDALGK